MLPFTEAMPALLPETTRSVPQDTLPRWWTENGVPGTESRRRWFEEAMNGGPIFGSASNSSVAVCITDHMRSPSNTFASILDRIVEPLDADVLLFVPDVEPTSIRLLRRILGKRVPAAFEAATRDASPDDFRAMMQPHTEHYEEVAPVALSPLACNITRLDQKGEPHCTHMMSIYWGQQWCLEQIEQLEQRRGRKYEWVAWSRGELQWVHSHPPVHLLSKDSIHVPACRNDWANGL